MLNILNRIIFFPAFLIFITLWMIGTLLASIYGYFQFSSDFKFKIKWFKGFYPDHIQGLSDKISFHEYIWNIGAGKFGSVMGVINNLGWGTIILATFHLDKFLWLVPIAVVAYPLGVYSLGYFLHKIGYIYRQGDVNNRLTNPQLVRTERKVESILSKIEEKLK